MEIPVKKLSGSWFDFKRYLAQRRRLLANPAIMVSPGFPGQKDIPPLKFATQGLIIVAAVATLMGWGQKLVFREPADISSKPGDSEMRLGNIEMQLHFWLNPPEGAPPSSNEEIERIAHSILGAPILSDVQLDELLAALEGQKRKLHGLPTRASKLAEARIEVRKRMLDARVQLVKTQHKIEPEGLPGPVVVEQQDFIDDQLHNLNYDEPSETVTNVDAVTQQLIEAPELASATTGFLSLWLENEQNDANEQLQADKARATIAIKVLNRTVELHKQESKDAQTTLQRIQEISGHFVSIITALSLILSAYLFHLLVRVGRGRPSKNIEKANIAYLYIFTSGIFWLNVSFSIGSLVLADLWRFSPLGWKWLLIVSALCIITYFAWALKILYDISEKLREFFGMERPKHFYNVYRGSRKIGIDLVLSNVVGSAVVVALGTIVLFAYLHISKSLKL